MNCWNNTLRVFIDPRSVMESLSNKWVWFPAWVVAVIGTALSQIPAALRYAVEVDALIESGHVPTQVAIAQKWLTIVSNTLNPPIAYLGQAFMGAVILSFVAALTSSAKQGFGRWYAVAMWATLPAGLSAALFKALVLTLHRGPPALVFAGPAVLLPDESHGLLKVLFVSLDVFSLLFIGLCTVGVFELAGRKYGPATLAGILLFFYTVALNYGTWH